MIILLCIPTIVEAAGIRSYANRIKGASENNDNLLTAVLEGNADAMDELVAAQEQIVQDEDEMASILELMQQMANQQDEQHSMAFAPVAAIGGGTAAPSTSSAPSLTPSMSQIPSISMAPSSVPSFETSEIPTVVGDDGDLDGGNDGIILPGLPPVTLGGVAPVEPTGPPAPETDFPSMSPSISALPSTDPSASPSLLPSAEPSAVPSELPTTAPSLSQVPTAAPTETPTSSPSDIPTMTPSSSPTIGKCGMTPEERSERIMAILDSVASPIDLRTDGTYQKQATDWLIGKDELVVCPDDPKIVQRWALAVIYYATNGDDWLQCAQDGIDLCGFEDPFVGDSRFLSGVSECDWAGISCDFLQCVDEIEFGE